VAWADAPPVGVWKREGVGAGCRLWASPEVVYGQEAGGVSFHLWAPPISFYFLHHAIIICIL
jgi:hypothetical protein